MSMTTTIYGIGGYKSNHPNGNVIEMIEDNANGTGLKTLYDENGNVIETIQLNNLPITDQATQAEIDQLIAYEQMQDEKLTIPKSAVEQLASDMSDPSVNSISEVKQSINNFLQKIT